MIIIKIWFDENSCLEKFEAEGHSKGFPEGQNIVCAAVTVLLRTFANVLQEDLDAPEEGTLKLQVRSKIKNVDWMGGAAYFLITGLSDLQTEYPEQVKVVLCGKTAEKFI